MCVCVFCECECVSLCVCVLGRGCMHAWMGYFVMCLLDWQDIMVKDVKFNHANIYIT